MNLARRLDVAWRIVGTGLSFALFGIAGIVCGLTLFPAACLTAPDKDTARRRAQAIVSRWFDLFSRFMRLVGVIRYEFEGLEKLATPGAMIVANHPSLIDVVLLIGRVRAVDCIVKPGVFANPFMKWPVTWAGYICHDTPEQLLADCARALGQGHALMIFPEGTRSRPGEPIRMMHGAARIALEARATIVPVTITCVPLMLNKGVPWYRVPPRPGHYRLVVGEPYSAAQFLDGAAPLAIAARRLTHHWERYFAERTGAEAAHPEAQNVASGHNQPRREGAETFQAG